MLENRRKSMEITAVLCTNFKTQDIREGIKTFPLPSIFNRLGDMFNTRFSKVFLYNEDEGIIGEIKLESVDKNGRGYIVTADEVYVYDHPMPCSEEIRLFIMDGSSFLVCSEEELICGERIKKDTERTETMEMINQLVSELKY